MWILKAQLKERKKARGRMRYTYIEQIAKDVSMNSYRKIKNHQDEGLGFYTAKTAPSLSPNQSVQKYLHSIKFSPQKFKKKV